MKPATYWARERRGIAMSSRMFDALQILRAAKESEFPFIDLPGVYKSTIRALVERDWIFPSPGLDGIRYKITARGEKAMRIFEEPLRSNPNKICPDCGIRPKHVSSTGRLAAYCLECDRVLSRRKWQHKTPRFKSNTCPRCQRRPRHQYPGGRIATYCKRCTRTTKRQNKRKNKQRKIEQAKRGELMCIECKNSPRHYTENSVYDYCWSCWQAYMTRYNDKRRPNSKPALERNRKVGAR